MPNLAVGARLGPYEIIASIGSGGMGDVYRARDTRLDRMLAIKVSKEAFSERFDREARAVAALNHPHICTLHDVGPNYLVMEYVEGSPLTGPLPLDRALMYAAQICDALDAAHRKGVTHRDLKPANILVTKAGVKLLDFGLAKMASAIATEEAAITMAVTQKGQILGTLQYMSPEQLQGQESGPPSDIFSFGLVLYELLTGKRAFDGSSPASVIAAILERPAPSVADVAPPALDRLLKRCLEKDPEQRWQNARDLKAELEWIATGGGALPVTAPASSRVRFQWVVASLVAVVLIALAVARLAPWRTPSSPPAFTFTTEPGEGSRFGGRPMISPDGTRVAVIMVDKDGKRGMEVRHLDTGASQRLPGTENVASVSWSKDGRYLAFVDGLKLKRIEATGGPATIIGDFPPGNGPPFTAVNSTGVLLFSGRDGLYKIPISGGTAQKIAEVSQASADARRSISREGLLTGPQFLADDRHFLYWSTTGSVEDGTVYAGSIDAPPEQNRNVVLTGTSAVVFVRDAGGREYLLFAREGALMAQPFDSRQLEPNGEPFLIAPLVGMMGPTPAVSVSDNGVLVYTTDTANTTNAQLVWFDRRGTRVGSVGPPSNYREFSLSPEGSRVAIARSERGEGSNNTDIFVMDANTGSNPVRFTFDVLQDRAPVWSPDGKRLVFVRSNSGLFEKPVMEAGPERPLISPAGFPTDWSRDGHTIVYSLRADLMFLVDGKPSRFRETEFEESFAHLSPDGKWIAYTSSNSRKVVDVYVETVPATGAIWQVSDGGFQPRWSADGRELYYIRYSDAMLMAVPVMLGTSFSFGAPHPLFAVPTAGTGRGYAVANDGQRFLIPVPADEGKATPVTVTTNWARDSGARHGS
jgi:Tol biopolymer transport system component/predicted Ser/Thr protein kinase